MLTCYARYMTKEEQQLRAFGKQVAKVRKARGLTQQELANKLDMHITSIDNEQLPIVLFVCSSTTDLIYAKRRSRKLIADTWYWEDDDAERPRVRFTTVEKLKQSGLLAKGIWEQA